MARLLQKLISNAYSNNKQQEKNQEQQKTYTPP